MVDGADEPQTGAYKHFRQTSVLTSDLWTITQPYGGSLLMPCAAVIGTEEDHFHRMMENT